MTTRPKPPWLSTLFLHVYVFNSRRNDGSSVKSRGLSVLNQHRCRLTGTCVDNVDVGTSTPAEMFLMVSEKMDAMEHKAIIARGGNPSLVIENYQKIVAANVARLS